MPAVWAGVAVAAGSALASWYANRERNNAQQDAARSTWNNRESEAYKRRAILAGVLRDNPRFARLGFTEDQLKGLVGQPREFTGADPNAGQYADLASGLLGAMQYAPTGSTEAAAAPYYLAAPGGSYAPNTGGPSASSLPAGFKMCSGGGISDWAGNCPGEGGGGG